MTMTPAEIFEAFGITYAQLRSMVRRGEAKQFARGRYWFCERKVVRHG